MPRIGVKTFLNLRQCEINALIPSATKEKSNKRKSVYERVHRWYNGTIWGMISLC